MLVFSFTTAECNFVSENLFPCMVVLLRVGASKSIPSLCYFYGSTAGDELCLISPKWLYCLSKFKASGRVKEWFGLEGTLKIT